MAKSGQCFSEMTNKDGERETKLNRKTPKSSVSTRHSGRLCRSQAFRRTQRTLQRCRAQETDSLIQEKTQQSKGDDYKGHSGMPVVTPRKKHPKDSTGKYNQSSLLTLNQEENEMDVQNRTNATNIELEIPPFFPYQTPLTVSTGRSRFITDTLNIQNQKPKRSKTLPYNSVKSRQEREQGIEEDENESQDEKNDEDHSESLESQDTDISSYQEHPVNMYRPYRKVRFIVVQGTNNDSLGFVEGIANKNATQTKLSPDSTESSHQEDVLFHDYLRKRPSRRFAVCEEIEKYQIEAKINGIKMTTYDLRCDLIEKR